MPGQSVPPSSVLLYPTCFFFTFLCSIQNEIMSLICSLLLVVCNSPVACKSSEPRTRPASIHMGEGAHTEQLSRFQLLSSPYLGDHLLKGPRMFTGKRASGSSSTRPVSYMIRWPPHAVALLGSRAGGPLTPHTCLVNEPELPAVIIGLATRHQI